MTSSPGSEPAHWLQPARVRLLERLACTLPTAVFLAVYVPLAGHGFLSDDFRWVLNSQIESVADVFRLFRITDGFYRPLVSLTFGLDRLAFGINPRPYGWTNVGLVLVGALLIRQLAVDIGADEGSGNAGRFALVPELPWNQSIHPVGQRPHLSSRCLRRHRLRHLHRATPAALGGGVPGSGMFRQGRGVDASVRAGRLAL